MGKAAGTGVGWPGLQWVMGRQAPADPPAPRALVSVCVRGGGAFSLQLIPSHLVPPPQHCLGLPDGRMSQWLQTSPRLASHAAYDSAHPLRLWGVCVTIWV